MIDELNGVLPGVIERLAEMRRAAERVLDRDRFEVATRADFGGIAGAELHTDAVELVGLPSERLTVRRRLVGDVVRQPFAPCAGITRCATEAADVRALWERLLASEAKADGMLHGNQTSVLDVPGACVSIRESRILRVDMTAGGAFHDGTIAVPRLTHAMPPRKLRNFGHWLVDCLPQVVALAAVDPTATVLLPPGLKPFHRWTLARIGLEPSQIVEWDGASRGARRVLAFETDGRASGGRPLSGLQLLRRTIGPDTIPANPERAQRIYVSRRDARAKRQWVRNEAAIEELFRQRGFDIVSMAQCPLDEQVEIFRNARVVAGVSGAGLTGLLFSPSETQAIVLTTDSLVRWYADQGGARSLWLRDTPRPGQLAALGDSPRFYAYLAAAFGQVAHSFVGGDELPIDALASFLDAVSARAEHR